MIGLPKFTRPTMHRQEEIIKDLKGHTFISDATMLKWYNDRYSTSKHLLTLYSLARGIKAKRILEIGFGRSSFVLARCANENKGAFVTCDTDDFRYLMSNEEKMVVKYVHGSSSKIWNDRKFKADGFDFAFLDYFSSESVPEYFCKREIENCLALMKKNSVIAIHDSIVKKYNLRKAIEKLKKKNDLEVFSFPYNYGLCLIRKLSKSKYGTIQDRHKKKI